jgi:uncharacterized protein YjbI with pentapeptide repeats
MPERPFLQGQTLEGLDKLGYKGEYEQCTFVDCDFSNADLGGSSFGKCTFRRCNLSNARLNGAAFREVKFADCKLMGLHFDSCNPIGLEFSAESCLLNYSFFVQVKMRKTRFKDCQMREADFTGADFTDSVFDHCDLLSAVFDGTNLERADLSTAHSYSIDPEKNRIRRAKFSLPDVIGLLNRYDIEIR